MASAKKEKFERVAQKRVVNVLDKLDTLSKVSNTTNYEYSEEDVDKMMQAIRDKVDQVEASFQEGLKKGSGGKQGNTFSFRD